MDSVDPSGEMRQGRQHRLDGPDRVDTTGDGGAEQVEMSGDLAGPAARQNQQARRIGGAATGLVGVGA